MWRFGERDGEGGREGEREKEGKRGRERARASESGTGDEGGGGEGGGGGGGGEGVCICVRVHLRAQRATHRYPHHAVRKVRGLGEGPGRACGWQAEGEFETRGGGCTHLFVGDKPLPVAP